MASKISTDNNSWTSTCKPTQRELDWISKRAGDNWRSLLTNLGVDLDVIRGYYQSNSGNTINACFEGLVFWVKGNTESEEPVSYETLFEALKEANLSSSADDLEMKLRTTSLRHRPGAMEQADTRQQNGDRILTIRGGEPVFTIDRRSQKIEEIVDLYRRGGNKVSLPKIPDLEDDFDCIIEAVSSQLSSADSQVICKLHGMMRVKYRRYIHGVKPVELPSVPNTANGLCEFITEKSTPYEILLVHHTVEALNCEDLKTTLQSYESKLADHLRLTLGSFKRREVTLPLHKDHTHLAVTISKDQILLSLILHIKEYLMKYLQLEEAVFEGFGEGCTVLFFSILRIDAVLLAPKILSHSAELKRSFDITHLIVFDYFACDLEKGTFELLVSSPSFEQQLLIRDLKEELLRQFDQLQTSKADYDRRQVVAVFEKVQQELISTKKKLDVVEEGFVEAEKMLRTSTVSWSEDKSKCTSLEETEMSMEEARRLLQMKEEEIEKEREMLKNSRAEWAKQKDELEATSLRSEPVLQFKDLKEEMLHQFEQLQTSKVNEDAMKYEQLQNESISLKMKLKEEEMLRKKAEEEQRRIARELVKMEKKWSDSYLKSNVILKKAISDVEGLLGQSSESVEGLQDKIRILVEEWSNISEHELEATSLSTGQLHQIEDLKEEMLHQFEQLKTSQKQNSTLRGTLCKDHLDTIEKAVEGYQKVAVFLEDSGLLEGKLSLSIDLCQLAVEKKAEVDSMLEVLQTKQNELQSHQHLYWMLKGKKHKAIPKEEFATPKTASKKETWDTDTTTEKENWDTASEKENSEIYIEDDTDIDLISSASENIPQKRPEESGKVWKEEEASSLHYAQDKLTSSFATLVSVFKHLVEVTAKDNRVEDSIVVLCQATLARREGTGELPILNYYYNLFNSDILKNTTIFDIEMIRVVANQIQQPALTDAVEKYEAVIKPLMKASIAELTERYIIEPVVQDPSKQAYKLVLKFPNDKLVRDLYHARYYLEKYLGISEAKLLTLPKRW